MWDGSVISLESQMHYIYYAYVFMHSCTYLLTYLLTYLHSWLCAHKTGNISETVEDRAKVTINLPVQDTGFRLRRKCMTLNDLWARFKVIDSSNAAKWRNTA